MPHALRAPMAVSGGLSLTRRPVSRRAVVAAGLAGLAYRGAPPAAAQSDAGLTRSSRWVEAEEVGVARAEAIGEIVPEPIVFATPWPATAVAPHWSGKERPGATIELAYSADGERWSDPLTVGEDGDSGRPGKGGRRYGPPIVTGQAAFVRYRSFNAAGRPAAILGLAWESIDAAVGPGSLVTAQEAAATPSAGNPPVITRAAWGADESLRFANGWEIWPPEYAPVAHAIVHHSDTVNYEDPLVAIRSIYYYHAVTRGWGDIGYNRLVDYLGNVYEGRAGGEGVVGGHAAGYNVGTFGVCTIGRFHGEEPTPEMGRALVAAVAWATRALDPLAEAPFADIAGLPTICAHRDVNPTSCPGDALYADLGWLREEVAAVAAGDGAGTDAEPADAAPPEFRIGDAVATTDADVTLREGPGLAAAAVATLPIGEPLVVAEGPVGADGLAWYRVEGASLAGWVAADWLTAVTPAADPEAAVGGMDGGSLDVAQPVILGEGTTAAVTGGDLVLRDGPGGEVVDTLPEGAWVEITGRPEERGGTLWYPVDTGLDSVGWVSGDYLRPV